MKRIFLLFLVALMCISLCVNIAFASDVVTGRVEQNIFVYFPWFGGVSGSSASRVTNYATVTTSDVSTIGSTVTNIASVAAQSGNGLTITSNGGYINVTGTCNITGNRTMFSFNAINGHIFFIDSFSSSFPGFCLETNSYSYFNSTLFTANASGFKYIRIPVVNGQSYDYSVACSVFDLTAIFGAGNEPSNTDAARAAIGSMIGGYEFFTGSRSSALSTFSLVPAPAANGGSSAHQINDYTWYEYEADISVSGSSNINRVYNAYFLDDTYNWYFEALTLSQYSTSANLVYMPDTVAQYMNSLPSTIQYLPYTPGQTFSYTNNGYTINHLARNIYYAVDPNVLPFGTNTLLTDNTRYYFSNINLPLDDTYGVVDGNSYSYYYSNLPDIFDLEALAYVGNDTYTGTFVIDRIFRTSDNSYFLFNNQVNLGTYDFNVNVKFPSLDKFNAFSGYWSASFNTSWGEIPVRTQIQEVSANSDTLIKIYKLTFDVPFTGQYTKFNIKYVGDSSAFTTIRVDSSVVDPNAYQNGAGPTTINGLSFYLSSMFDKLWGKVRSLFFDQDQTMAESVPALAGELADEVSSGTETIHEFETNNFDSIEQQQEDLDWDIPLDFGQASNPTSALGFIATVFSGLFFALGSKITPIIVIPLMLGLCLLILGRGSLALGQIASSGARSASRIRRKGR